MYRNRINILEASILAVIVSLILWPSYLSLKIGSLPSINPTRILILQAFLLWIFAILLNPFYHSRFINFIKVNRKLLLFIMVPMFGWKLFTAMISVNRLPSIFSAFRDTVYYFGLFAMAANVWCSFLQAERVVKAFVFTSIFVVGIALIERTLQQNLFACVIPASFILAESLIEGFIRDSTYRVCAVFPHPLALANYCTTVIPLVVWYAAIHHGLRRWVGYCICVGLLITLYISTSRGGLVVLSFMAGGFLTTTYLPRWAKRVGVISRGLKKFISCILVFFIVAMVGYTGTKLTIGRTEKEAGSTNIRVLQMELALPLVVKRPLTGYGPGEAGAVLGLRSRAVDNYYLSLPLESGLPEVAFFIMLLLYFLNYSWKLQRSQAKTTSTLATAIFWSIVGNALFLTVLSLEQLMPIMFLLFGMLLALNSCMRHA